MKKFKKSETNNKESVKFSERSTALFLILYFLLVAVNFL
jgi:hypothetical protein